MWDEGSENISMNRGEGVHHPLFFFHLSSFVSDYLEPLKQQECLFFFLSESTSPWSPSHSQTNVKPPHFTIVICALSQWLCAHVCVQVCVCVRKTECINPVGSHMRCPFIMLKKVMRHCHHCKMSVRTSASISSNEVEWHYQMRPVVISKATPALIILISYYYNPLTSLMLMIHWLDSDSKISPEPDATHWLEETSACWSSLMTLMIAWPLTEIIQSGFSRHNITERTFLFEILLSSQSIIVWKMQRGPHMLEGDELCWPTKTHRPVLHSAFHTIYWHLTLTHGNNNKSDIIEGNTYIKQHSLYTLQVINTFKESHTLSDTLIQFAGTVAITTGSLHKTFQFWSVDFWLSFCGLETRWLPYKIK